MLTAVKYTYKSFILYGKVVYNVYVLHFVRYDEVLIIYNFNMQIRLTIEFYTYPSKRPNAVYNMYFPWLYIVNHCHILCDII